ncbi:putative beta-glucosidase [Medicago truncatula]|uniref:Putative beta-glucosidase n=1 Tax=Medicago truncatula TaxID=3880 RepID=A0A396JD26_MEDTR|nr:putative beta-glucosidase [Medicago truncatula]
MALLKAFLIFTLLNLLTTLPSMEAVSPILDVSSLNRTSFPTSFIFGTGSSSYQYEGAAKEGGRGASIWDTYTHKYPEKIRDKSNGDVAIDQYYRYKEDVGIMRNMNLDAYRFSISWSRIVPRKLNGGINQEGVKYYNNLINELLANGLQPFVTLFHWDLPQTLEDEYGGFLSPLIVNDFQDYAELCFKEFGDRVKYWTTFNEPYAFSNFAYTLGFFAPGRCSKWFSSNCTGGDSGKEPYIVSHHQLLAHAAVVHVYKKKYQESQKGVIGITLASHWFLPLSDKKLDQNAVERGLDFMLGWFMEPLTTGKYPQSMHCLVGKRLPKFSKKQARLLKGSFDFVGLNYYTSMYATNAPQPKNGRLSYDTDSHVNFTSERNGVPIGQRAASNWLYVYPKGIQELLLYVKKVYNNPLIYITENGIDEFNDPTLSLEEALMDTYRIDYYHRHLFYIRSAIKNGVNVKGYFAWSLLDNFEWTSGYTTRFGMNFVDYKNGLKRHPKLSAKWFKNFLKRY